MSEREWPRMLLGWLAAVTIRAPRAILFGAVTLLGAAAVIAAPILTSLSAGGYVDPNSESMNAQQVLSHRFQAGGMPLVFTISAAAGVDGPEARAQAEKVTDVLRASQFAHQIDSYWTAPPQLARALRSTDGQTGLVVAQIAGDDSTAPRRANSLAAPLIGTHNGVHVAAGGLSMVYYQSNEASRIDMVRVEAIAIPFTFLVLVWVFGSVVASMIPLAVAMFATVVTAAALRCIAALTDVSVFALNLSTSLCLALAIDYSLFIISRYREEIARGQQPNEALRRTMQIAGRTVCYSAFTVAISLTAMAIFPMYFLRSLAYAGLVCVAMCLLASLTIAPALIVVLGDRIDQWDIRAPILRRISSRKQCDLSVEDSYWYRAGMAVMRHAVPVAVGVGAVLILVGWPFHGVKFGYPDDRALPTSESARQVGDTLRQKFSQDNTGAVRIVFPAQIPSPQNLDAYAASLSDVEGVTSVAAPGGTFVHGRMVNNVSHDADFRDGAAYLTVSSTKDPFSGAGRDELERLKRIQSPAPALFDGLAQQTVDNTNGVVERIPLVLALIGIVTIVFLFMLTGSIVIPIKALILNLLSLSAGFGALVWIFQDGHLGGLDTSATGYLAAHMPPLIFCIAFGISMDYEVFVISRMQEEWLNSNREASDNTRAVALGLARTGPIVTAAASVMAIVFAAMVFSQMPMIKMLGLGLAITVLMDAFVIRTILVPATMYLIGRANWWAPAPLARWHAKRRLSVSAVRA